MACRKAADRALAEIAEWKARQEDATAAAWREREELLKPKWAVLTESSSPSQLRLCYSWLQDGWERGPNCGCNGGCGKEHPRIVLRFDEGTADDDDGDNDGGGAIATVSHPLKPFQDYFGRLCEQKLATKIKTSEYNRGATICYRLRGYLQEHVDRIEKQTDFGFHLVLVTSEAMTASRRAHNAYQKAQDEHQQQQKTQAKKRKLDFGTSSSSSSDDSTPPRTLTKRLVDEVFQVVWDNHWFQDNLDLLDIHYWQMSGIACAGANRLAQRRMQTLQLSVRVQLDGRTVHRFRPGFPPTRPRARVTYLDYGLIVVPLPGGGCQEQQYNVGHYDSATEFSTLQARYSSRLRLVAPDEFGCHTWSQQKDTSGNPVIGSYIVQQATEGFTTDNGNNPEQQGGNPVGHMLQVFVADDPGRHENQGQGRMMQEESVCFAPFLEVARHRILPDSPMTSTHDRVKFIFSHLSDDELPKLEIHSISFTFQDLVGVYVRRMLQLHRTSFFQSQRIRPASQAEKDVVRYWARAAREHVPGHARDYERLEEWETVPSKPIHNKAS